MFQQLAVPVASLLAAAVAGAVLRGPLPLDPRHCARNRLPCWRTSSCKRPRGVFSVAQALLQPHWPCSIRADIRSQEPGQGHQPGVGARNNARQATAARKERLSVAGDEPYPSRAAGRALVYARAPPTRLMNDVDHV